MEIYKRGIPLVDKALILRKLTELEEHLKQIKEFSNISVEDYSRE